MDVPDALAWCLDLGTVGFHHRFDAAVAIAARAGYDLVETPIPALVELGPSQVRSVLERAGVGSTEFSAPWTSPFDASVSAETFDDRMRALPAIAGQVALAGGTAVAAFFNGNRSGATPLTFEELTDRCARVAEVCALEGLEFHAELHDRLHAERAAELVDAVAVPGFGLLFDSFHAHRHGLGDTWFASLPHRAIGWVHLSGFPFELADPDAGMPRLAPFAGCDDTEAVLHRLRFAGYSRPLSLEVIDTVVRDVDDAAAHCASVLDRARSGVARIERAG